MWCKWCKSELCLSGDYTQMCEKRKEWHVRWNDCEFGYAPPKKPLDIVKEKDVQL